VVAVAALTAAAAGGWALAWVNLDRAESWQESTLELRELRDELTSTLADVEQQLEESQAVLANTEVELAERTSDLEEARSEVAELDSRLVTLANEKAVAEDEREFARDEAELWASWVAAASGVGAQLDDCIDRMNGWLGRTPSYFDGEGVWSSWSDEGGQVGSFCGQARADFWDLQGLLDQ
jgi:Skp family chaperone for outer membrane proteins